ncbi:MAG TPA: Mur ligase family protein [Acidimicrobiales bacterium]|jgi:dihydrofolate synthase/folylpolyglutamate synthase|nr:Mur ligase family protein [Acidimicrobiales bacterium]
MELGDALEWLDAHQNLERMLSDRGAAVPDPARMRRLVHVLGDPQSALPVLHVTGTNGKTSTARALTQLLMAKGLSVGTFTSPHLERINERICANGEAIGDDDLADALSGVASVEALLEVRPTWFEILAAAAFRTFADLPVDAAVVEVGIGGRWDATNVVDATVAVVTNVGLDHGEFLGPTRADVAAEKAGIVKPGSTLVLGETDPELYPIFERESPAQLWWAGRDYAVESNELAVGGRLLDLRTPKGHYDEVFLGLNGRHQGSNFADAVVGAEAFFGAPIEPDLVVAAASAVRSPGRLEVVGRRPLVVLDGAKNLEGARTAAAALDDFGPVASRILVVGMLAGKDAAEMLEALDGARARLVVACPPPSPRAQPSAVVAAAAAGLGSATAEAESVSEALEIALAAAGVDDLILVTGSLYVVGAARTVLAGRLR